MVSYSAAVIKKPHAIVMEQAADWLGITTESLKATLWTVGAAIMTNLDADAILEFSSALQKGELISAAARLAILSVLILITIFSASRAVEAWLIIDVRDLAEKPDVPAHGAVILALSTVDPGERWPTQVKNYVDKRQASGVPQVMIVEEFMDDADFDGCAWQAAIKALWPHINVDGKIRVPPVRVLTSGTPDADGRKSDDQYPDFLEACTKLLGPLVPDTALPIEPRKGFDFENFNPLRGEIRTVLEETAKLARKAPEGVARKVIIDVTGAPRPFAIAAASLTLGSKADGFSFVSQGADKKLKFYNLVVNAEKAKG
jgi:hypothetical protein